MNKALMAWLGQVTTGHGVMVLTPTLLALLTGSMTWGTAAPLLLAGIIGLLWPENMRLQNESRDAASNLETMIAAYAANSPAAAERVPHK